VLVQALSHITMGAGMPVKLQSMSLRQVKHLALLWREVQTGVAVVCWSWQKRQ